MNREFVFRKIVLRSALFLTGMCAASCQDWYGASEYYSRGGISENPHGPTSGAYQVIRGGSWNYAPVHARSTNRYMNSYEYRDFYIGFRLAM